MVNEVRREENKRIDKLLRLEKLHWHAIIYKIKESIDNLKTISIQKNGETISNFINKDKVLALLTPTGEKG